MITATELLAISNSPTSIQNNLNTIQEHLSDEANAGKTVRYNEFIHPDNVLVITGLGYTLTKENTIDRYVISWQATS